MADKLETLARLRRLEAQTARRALEAASAELRQAADAEAAANAAIAMEARVAGSSAAFAAWLPRAQHMVAATRAAVQQAERRQDAARADFIESRAAEKSVETLLDQRETQARALAARRQEHALSDLYRPTKRT